MGGQDRKMLSVKPAWTIIYSYTKKVGIPAYSVITATWKFRAVGTDSTGTVAHTGGSA